MLNSTFSGDYLLWYCFVCFLGTVLSGAVLSGTFFAIRAGLFCGGLFCLGLFCLITMKSRFMSTRKQCSNLVVFIAQFLIVLQ